MPNALAGEGDSKGYSFTIKASSDDVKNFYQTKMTDLGWNEFASGQGATKALLMFFMKGSDTITISIIPQPKEVMYVLIVK